jgi:hypothetical protein
LKPEKKINELLLLTTIFSYTKEYGFSPTAEVLMGLKSKFAPSLTEVDTLRMWLIRHRNRTIRRVNKRRPYRYEVNRQGEKRIVYLVKRELRRAISIAKLGVQPKHNMLAPYKIARELEKTVEEKLRLVELFSQFLAA